jgi:hypothetical protein
VSRHPKPTNLADLAAYLRDFPAVTTTNFNGTVTDDIFVGADGTGFFFICVDGNETFLPINCRMGAAAAHESGVTIDDLGFTLTKFGKTIRVDYREE